jgi:hypothetical protein
MLCVGYNEDYCMTEANMNQHIGLEAVKCYEKYFDYQEKKLHGFIDKMSHANIEIKIISDVMNKLSHGKQKDKQCDFTNDEQMKSYIAHIHKNNPTIFDGLVQGLPDHIAPPSKELALHGDDITLHNVLNETLRDINLRNVTIDILKEEEIDIIVQGLDGQIKMHTADLNEQMLKINENYDNRSQMTEHARQVIKQSGDLLESINRKMAN